jgi:hypothetical protein
MGGYTLDKNRNSLIGMTDGQNKNITFNKCKMTFSSEIVLRTLEKGKLFIGFVC